MSNNSVSETIRRDDLCDMRDLAAHPHMIVFGEPGSGKSYTVKKDIVNVLRKFPQDKVIVIDTCSDYGSLAEAYGGLNFRMDLGKDTVLLNAEDGRSDNNLIVFDIGHIPYALWSSAYHCCLEEASRMIQKNHAKGINTWLYLEGAPLTPDNGKFDALVRRVIGSLWGFGCRITYVVNSIEAMSDTDAGHYIVENSATALILRLTKAHARMLKNYYGFSDECAKKLPYMTPGDGLLVRDGKVTRCEETKEQ